MIQLLFNSLINVFIEMSPYLLLGFLMAGIFSVLIPKELVEKHLSKDKLWSVVKASFLGVPLPLCSCSVIPVAATIKNKGASNGATTAFLISTPQTGIDSILVSYAILGPIFAIFTPVAAFVSGITGGILVNIFSKNNNSDPITENPQTNHTSCSCSPKNEGNIVYKIFHHGFVEIPKDIAKPLIIGIIIASIISIIIPKDFFSGYIGTGLTGMLIMMIFGIPLYVCATASIPIAAALMLKGADPGAVFVFLMAGPATNAATLATIWKLMGRKTLLLYLISVAICALTFGFLLNSIYYSSSTNIMQHHHVDEISIYNILASILLIIVFLNVFFQSPLSKIFKKNKS